MTRRADPDCKRCAGFGAIPSRFNSQGVPYRWRECPCIRDKGDDDG